VKGKNGFVCIVGRSWTAAADADYWDPKVRVPMCVNAAAAHSYLPRFTRITELILAGRTQAQMTAAIAAAIDKAADMDEALAWGRKAMIACRASVEVRPFLVPA
jgi:hypothetical protein